MKISFLITYYNQEDYVRQSLDSVMAIRKPENWEILIGDDGSTDSTVDIVEEYIRKEPERIRLIRMPRESGKKYDGVKRASANRLTLLENCTGDCYCVLDGDDFYCDTEFVQDAIGKMEGDSRISVVAFAYREYVNGADGTEHRWPGMQEGYVSRRHFLRKLYIPAGACVHRRFGDEKRLKQLQRLGYFDDNNIVINSLTLGEMYHIDRTVYAYRQTGNSIFNSMSIMEQAVLNVQGMDVDLQIAGDAAGKDILNRYASHLVMMYLARKRIRGMLGEEKYGRYLEACSGINGSVAEKLLRYETLTDTEKREVRRLVHQTWTEDPVRGVAAGIRYGIRGGKA